MTGMAVNKVVYGTTVLVDLTADTVTAENLKSGVSAHAANGERITGTMPDQGAVAAAINGTTVTSYTIPRGYHDGSGTVSLDGTIEAALAAI